MTDKNPNPVLGYLVGELKGALVVRWYEGHGHWQDTRSLHGLMTDAELAQRVLSNQPKDERFRRFVVVDALFYEEVMAKYTDLAAKVDALSNVLAGNT